MLSEPLPLVALVQAVEEEEVEVTMAEVVVVTQEEEAARVIHLGLSLPTLKV